MQKEQFTTKSFQSCFLKLLIYAITILVGCYFGFDGDSYTPFYLAIFLQSANNIYDACGFLNTDKYSKGVVLGQAIVASGAAVSCMMALAYWAQGNRTKELLETEGAVFTSTVLLAITLGYLALECRKHYLQIDSSDVLTKSAVPKLKKGLYYPQSDDDVAVHWPDRS